MKFAPFLPLAEARPLALLNRSPGKGAGRFVLPEDGMYQVVAKGQAPNVHPLTGEPVVQVVDDAALEAIERNLLSLRNMAGIREILVDREHLSSKEDGDSSAMAWAQIDQMERRADGLYMNLRWTEAGEKAVTGGELRYVSPSFAVASAEKLGGNRVRPTELVDAGLTNRPNFGGMVALSNKTQSTEYMLTKEQEELLEKGRKYDGLEKDFNALKLTLENAAKQRVEALFENHKVPAKLRPLLMPECVKDPENAEAAIKEAMGTSDDAADEAADAGKRSPLFSNRKASAPTGSFRNGKPQERAVFVNKRAAELRASGMPAHQAQLTATNEYYMEHAEG